MITIFVALMTFNIYSRALVSLHANKSVLILIIIFTKGIYHVSIPHSTVTILLSSVSWGIQPKYSHINNVDNV